MPLNEKETCKQLIEPKLEPLGWEFERELRIGPGRVNFSGDNADSMHDPTQAIIADYLLRYRGVPLAILEAKAELEDAADGMQQGSRYAERLMIRHSIASNQGAVGIGESDRVPCGHQCSQRLVQELWLEAIVGVESEHVGRADSRHDLVQAAELTQVH